MWHHASATVLPSLTRYFGVIWGYWGGRIVLEFLGAGDSPFRGRRFVDSVLQ